MDDSLKVQIFSRKLIKPSNPTPSHLRSFKLSLFDQLAPPLYVHVLFYYLLDEDHNRAKNDERFAQMQKSLSWVLSKYYPLAGRFLRDELLIDCADQGVEYFEAQVNGELVEFLQERPEIELLDKFLTWDPPPSPYLATSPLVAVQINKFECGGVVVGIQISHFIADASSMMTFLKEWANSCTSPTEVYKVLSPNYNDHIVSIFPARTLSGPKPRPPADYPAKIVTQRFLLDETMIEKIMEGAALSCSKCNFHPSRVVVALALIWRALLGVCLAKRGHFRDSIVAIAMNLRGKTALTISEPNYGNFWTSVIVPLEAKNAKIELQELMILLDNRIKSTSEKLATASPEDISSMLIDSRREIIEKRYLSVGIDVYVCTSWCRFPIQEVDFGWGKPHWVSHASKAFEAIGLMDAKKGEGLEAWVSLKEEDMTEFKRELEVLVPVPK
ncbi:acetyl-CoA-benzylalcohol acetyltransferase-like [Coffea arabica]|uniref:Acetyl-CoA-benzylalcohol acetyltransferase-like n=1 Tax=Coffea arabica TaxID=13443 RepID=A0A6P6W0E7_COFAR|nr:acetyl-CoA-benzylalcohol acetyltransferase-like [Coffea arabica]